MLPHGMTLFGSTYRISVIFCGEGQLLLSKVRLHRAGVAKYVVKT